MSETAKQVAAVLSVVVSLAFGLYLAYVLYNNQMTLAIQYGLGYNLWAAGAVALLVTVVGSVVLYKGMHPY